MSAKDDRGRDDGPEVPDTLAPPEPATDDHHGSPSSPGSRRPPVGRHDDHVRDQFVWEVGETLELIRTITIGGSAIEGVSVVELCRTCIAGLRDLGETLELDEFVARVDALAAAIESDPLDGALVDKHIDELAAERWAWPT